MKRELYTQMLNFTDLSCYFTLLSLINTYNDSDFPICTPLNEHTLAHRTGTKKEKNQGCFCRSEQSWSIPLLQFSKTKEDKEHLNLLQGSLSWSTAAFINLSHGTYAAPGTKVTSQMKINLTNWCSVFWLTWCMNCPFVDAGNWIKWRSHTVRERVASSFKASLLATCDKSGWNWGLSLLIWI